MTIMKSETIRRAVNGRWVNVLSVLAPELGGAIDRQGRHVPCPVHGGRDGFRLFKDANMTGGGVCNTCGSMPDGFALLMWLKGWDFPTTLAAVAEVIGVEPRQYAAIADQRTLPPATSKANLSQMNKLKALLRKLWRESLPWQHPDAQPLRRYLQNRGLDIECLPSWMGLRYHPRTQCRSADGEYLGLFPAMLALLEKNGQPITLHRTFLTEDGYKAPVEASRMMMPIPSDRNPCGAAIQFGQPGRVLSVAEGIETALAVYEATCMITWSLVNTALMASFDIPAGVEKLIIWADLDRNGAGLIAAEKLAERAKSRGLDVIVRVPGGPLPDDAKSIDWLDVHVNGGVVG